MNEELEKTLKHYESVKLQIKELKDVIDGMKPFILENIPEGTSVETDIGKFSIQSKSKWTFSDRLISLANQLEEGQVEEKADGTAKEEKGDPFIVYKQSK